MLMPLLLLASCCAAILNAEDAAAQSRAHALTGTFGTYCRAPHLPNAAWTCRSLVDELVDVHANTHSFCIHTQPTD